MSYTVAQNTSFLTAASVLQHAISFVYFLFVARTIGVDNTGMYFFAIAFTTIFAVAADLGLGSVLTREAARSPENSDKYSASIFLTKLFLGLIAYGLAAVFVNIMGYSSQIKFLVYLSGVTMFFDNLNITFYSLLRAHKNLLYEAAGIVGAQFLTLIIGGTALILHQPLYWLILAYTIPSACTTVYSFFSARHVLKIKFSFKWDKKIAIWALKIALPFALAGFIGRLYSFSDSLLMSKILTPTELGWWSVPYKITFAFQFIPAALTASIYPTMSTLFVSEKEKIGQLFAKAWNYLLIIVLPLAFGLMAVAKPAILLYKSDYLPSIPVLRILLVSLIFGFLSFVTGATLNAINRQKVQTTVMGLSLLVSIILNLILLPHYGIIGAAWTAVVGNIFLCFAGVIMVRKEVSIPWVEINKQFQRIFWPAAIMGLVVYLAVAKLNFIVAVPLGAIMYAALLFATRAVTLPMLKNIIAKTKIESEV